MWLVSAPHVDQSGSEIAAEAADPADLLPEPQQFLAELQTLPDLDAHGYVLQHGDAAHRRAGVVAFPHRDADAHPERAAVRRDVSYFGLPVAADLHRGHPFGLHRRAIIGVDDVAGADRQQQIGAAPHDLAETPIDANKASACEIDLGNSSCSGLEQRLERRVLLGQGVRGGLALFVQRLSDPRTTKQKSG